ncbi:MAG TPA: ABC transporter permease [Anaerolineales bacterium]|nr:ABC transporter permease [Anaerolineales bacterium]
MSFFELFSFVLENLSRRKGRVAMTAIGVIIGTAAVVVLVSLGIGMQQSATSQLLNISELKQVRVDPGYVDSGSSFLPPNITPITDQAIAQFAALPGVTHVVRRDWMMGGGMLRYGRLESWIGFLGVAGITDLSEMGYTAQAGDLVLERGSAIIGMNVPMNFYDPKLRPGQEPPPPPDLFGQTLKLILIKYDQQGTEIRKSVQIKIKGVISETRTEPDWSVYVPLEDVEAWNLWFTGRRPNRDKDGYPTVIVQVEQADQSLDVADRIKEMGFNAWASQGSVQGISNFFLVVQIIFGGIGAVSLLVAAIGIANTMAMAILERTREIGLMKAVGATNRDVLTIFLGEAAGIGFLGGLGGLVLGWSVGQVINVLGLVYLAGQTGGMPGMPLSAISVVTPTWLLVFALVFATLIGLISGVYPALRAATLIPVNALKYE